MEALSRTYLPQASTRGRFARGEAPAEADPDHHLWRNGRLWWIAVTVHLPDWTKRRVRRSLGTADVVEARRRRDAILERIEAAPDLRLSLRYVRASRAGRRSHGHRVPAGTR